MYKGFNQRVMALDQSWYQVISQSSPHFIDQLK